MTQKEAIKELEFAKLTDDYMLHEALDIAIAALEREEIVIKKIPKGYHYDTETREFLVYRNYTGDEIHITKPTPLYRLEQKPILEKIRAEIEEERKVEHIPEDVEMWDYIRALDRTLSIIDKYRIESEG